MKRFQRIGALGAMLTIFVSLPANAALVSALSGQAVYDTDRDISWVADANLAASNTFGVTGINANGTMTWDKANEWIAGMNTANYLGFNDWRLPSTLVPDNGCTNSDGSPRTDSRGFDCTGSEMGHLFYDEFGATRLTSVLSTGDSTELAKFTNVQSNSYWSGSEFDSSNAWGFNFGLGGQGTGGKDFSSTFAWAVRSGDVSAVPVPAAVWLFGSGLIGLLGMARRKR